MTAIASIARKLNNSLATKRYAVGDGNRLPKPPGDALDFRTPEPGDHKRRIHAFYEGARRALDAGPEPGSAQALIRDAILLDLKLEYDVDRLKRRYAHRAQQAHDVRGSRSAFARSERRTVALG